MGKRPNMEDLYKKYMAEKANGNLPAWESISEAQIRKLYSNKNVTDNDIAALFEVTIGRVRYKRKKYGLCVKKISILRFFNGSENIQLHKLSQDSKERLLADENFDRLAIGLAHYFFRNGPVEDMHADSQLSESDMKTLNKYMVDRIARVLLLAKENRWLELELLLGFHMRCGSTWDKPDTNVEELYDVIANVL